MERVIDVVEETEEIPVIPPPPSEVPAAPSDGPLVPPRTGEFAPPGDPGLLPRRPPLNGAPTGGGFPWLAAGLAATAVASWFTLVGGTIAAIWWGARPKSKRRRRKR